MSKIEVGDVFSLPDGYTRNQVRYIYGLIDPRAVEQVRYVGVAKHPLIRLDGHYVNGGRFGSEINATEPKSLPHWIGRLVREGVLPASKVLEVTVLEKALERERFWIDHLQGQGIPLLNGDFLSRQRRGESTIRRPVDKDRAGAWMRTSRAKLGWSQQHLADLMKIHFSTVSRWESDIRGVPREVIACIEQALGAIEN